jgi:pantothenate kinase
MLLILDEWIIHDLQGDNGNEKQKETYAFLQKIKEKCDKISWISGSKFSYKYNKFCKFCGEICYDPELRKKIRFLESSFLRNPQKVEIITLDELNIEVEEYSHILKDINPDDHYIVKAYFYLKRKINEEPIIITTDEKLVKKLRDLGVQVDFRHDFILNYK